jgi:putative nucleotidyltransferase with HDIG domain
VTQPRFKIFDILVAALFGFIGGLLTIVFAAGGMPINESLFGVLTDIRLLELTNADLPVLSQLAVRAPGTNQHSHAVGQLAEDACRAIGANAILARVGALYHDIGKVAAPDHFVENQSGENPHDRLRPIQSAKIITSHVTYGLRLAKEVGLPKRVADFIPQHHGTRTLHFFLQKAQAAANGKPVNERDFRYPGPKPQFKEAAILMLVDSAEAAARSLAQPNPENIRAIVAKIFDAVVNDGQLDESHLSLPELGRLREAIVNSLVAIYHPRINYPGFNAPSGSDEPITKHNLTYAQPADVPINPSGEVEEEAMSWSEAPDKKGV